MKVRAHIPPPGDNLTNENPPAWFVVTVFVFVNISAVFSALVFGGWFK